MSRGRPKHITDMEAFATAQRYLERAEGDYEEAVETARNCMRGRRNADLVIRALEMMEEREPYNNQ